MDDFCQGLTFNVTTMECKFGKLIENFQVHREGIRILAVKGTVPEKIPHIHVYSTSGRIEDISMDEGNSSLVDHGEWLQTGWNYFIGFGYKDGMYRNIFQLRNEYTYCVQYFAGF